MCKNSNTNEMKEPIRVALVDDHTVVREGIQTMLRQDKAHRFKIVGGFSNGQDFLNFLRTDTCDVALMDIQMPGKSGANILEVMSQKHPNVSVIVLSMITQDYMIEQCMKLGAYGYLPKEATVTEIKTALETAHQKNIYFNKLLSPEKLEYFKKGKKDKNTLSLREKLIISLIAAGQNNDEIGLNLNISPSTVKKHKENVFKKTSCDNVAQLIRFALENGLSDKYSS